MKTKLFPLFLLLLFMGCKPDQPAEKGGNTKGKTFRFFAGTYTDGESEGIYAYEIDAVGKLKPLGLKTRTFNPSYLAKVGEDYLLAVNELGTTDLFSAEPSAALLLLEKDGDSLLIRDRTPVPGSYPCHIAVHPDGWVVSSNYGGGSLSLYRIKEEGALTLPLDTLVFEGSGLSDRQQSPHAHSSHFLEGSLDLLALDLGSDRIWKTAIDPSDSTFVKPFGYAVKPGSGPRHGVFHPNQRWLYVLQELTSEVSKIEVRNLRDTVRSIEPTYQSALPNDFRGSNTGAEIRVTRDGRFLYASNRGHNSIAAFRISPTRGTLEALFFQSTAGRTPRNFALTPDERFLLVANQDSETLVSFRRDSENGTLTPVDTLAAPTPVYLLFDESPARL